MAWSGSCSGERVCGTDRDCAGCRHLLAHSETHALATREIPVRRYGTVPDLADDAPEWGIQSSTPGRPRTIAEYGGGAVLATALAAAVMAGLLIYQVY